LTVSRLIVLQRIAGLRGALPTVCKPGFQMHGINQIECSCFLVYQKFLQWLEKTGKEKLLIVTTNIPLD